MMLATIVERSADLLKLLTAPYGVVTGIMLKYSFDWSSQTKSFDTTRSRLAFVLAVAALGFSVTLALLFGGIAMESLTNDGDVEPTLVVHALVTLVVLGLVLVSMWAILRAVRHLREIRPD
jgi:hypothetical protein